MKEDEEKDEDRDEDEEESVKFNEWMKEMEEWKQRLEEWRHECIEAMKERKPMPPMPPMAPMPVQMPMPFMRHMRHMHHMQPFRSNVIASRIRDDELRAIDMLIEAGLFNTRSEAVAYLVSEGIKAKKDTFDRVSSTLQDIRRIRGEADEYLAKLRREVGLSQANTPDRPVRQESKCPKCGRDFASLPEDIKLCPYCGSNLK